MKKVLIGSFVLLAAVVNVSAQKTTKVTTKTTTKVTAPVFKNLLDSFSYAAGFNVATNMKAQGISRVNIAIMQKGLDDVYKNNQPLLTPEASGGSMQRQLAIFSAEKDAQAKEKETAFFEANKKRQGIVTLLNGLQYEIIQKSSDSVRNRPIPTDTVIVNYIGTLMDGTEFDNSYKRGSPYATALNKVITGWTEILQLMSVGDHWKVYIPSGMAYGTNGYGNSIPPNNPLIFDMTLEGIRTAIAVPKTPAEQPKNDQ